MKICLFRFANMYCKTDYSESHTVLLKLFSCATDVTFYFVHIWYNVPSIKLSFCSESQSIEKFVILKNKIIAAG